MIRLINTCWTFFLWGVGLLAVVAVMVGAYVVAHLDDEIRQEVERLVASHYEHLDVRVGEARLVDGKGIEIRRLSLHERGASGESTPLLEIDEVFLVCPVQVKELIHGLPPLERVVIHRPHLHATRRGDGQWNVSDLLPLPSAGKKPLEVVVKKGIVEIACDPHLPSSRVIIREITGVVRPAARKNSEQREAVTDEWAVAVSATSSHCRQIKLSGRVTPADKSVLVSGRLSELSVTGRELAGLWPQSSAMLGELQQLRGSIQLKSLQWQGATDGPAGGELSARVQCEQVEIRHEALPDAIKGLSGEVVAGRGGIEWPHLEGSCGAARFATSFRRSGWAPGSPWSLSARVENLALRRRHWELLPEPLRAVWSKYRPEGVVDLFPCEVRYDGVQLRPHVKATCHDVSVLAEEFPYPLRHLHGEVEIRPTADVPGQESRLQLHLVGEAARARPVTIDADYAISVPLASNSATAHPVGWIRAAGQQLVVSDELISALADGPRRFVQELQPQGEFDFVWQASRSDPTREEPDKQLEMTLQGGSVNYVRFAYPLGNLRGKVVAANGQWDFKDLSATAGGGTVTCNGSLRPPEVDPNTARDVGPDGGSGPMLSLRFVTEQIALDPTLYAALPPHAQAAWDSLEPAGRVDATVAYDQELGRGPPEIEHWIVPYQQTVSIKPNFFPYRIEKLEGKIHFLGPEVHFHDMSGEHGATRMVAAGVFRKGAGGGWSLDLKDISVDRLTVDRELQSALPPPLQRLVTRLNPRGQISLDRSSIGFSRRGPDEPIASTWKVNFDMHHVSLDCGVPLENISGSVSLAGRGQGEQFSTEGELALDSLRWNKFFFHDVRGPLYADASRALFGQHATQARGAQRRRITARAYGGTVSGDAVVTLGARSQFSVSADYQAGDLRRLVTETWPTRENLTGVVYGRLELQGMSQSPETLKGHGTVALTDAELYQLPQLIRLFKILRGREPDETAFTQAEARFQISGRQVYFEELKLSGDALTLYGRGNVNFDEFDQRLSLTFYSDLVPSTASLAGLRSLMRQASNQLMRTHVDGTIAEPRFTQEPLPGLSDALQQFQQELDPQARRPDGERGARGLFGPFWR